ncbi:hypothetical protein CCP3SC15_630010 [Gammaproteobacteria bacterium]
MSFNTTTQYRPLREAPIRLVLNPELGGLPSLGSVKKVREYKRLLDFALVSELAPQLIPKFAVAGKSIRSSQVYIKNLHPSLRGSGEGSQTGVKGAQVVGKGAPAFPNGGSWAPRQATG